MQSLIFAILLAQPPAVPSGPPAVPSNKEFTNGNKSFVLFVRVERQLIPGYVSIRNDEYIVAGIAIAVAHGRNLQYYRLDPKASTSDILAEMRRRERELNSVPFVPRDDLGDRPQLWASTVDWFDGIEQYEPAKNTQSIYTMNGFTTHHIDRVPRARLEMKWQVPGGMESVNGWRSTLYRYVPTKPRTWIGDISIRNSSGFMQVNRGWKREYADGSQFHDVLSYQGRVFEHRVAEKSDGKWERRVAYRNVLARPPGYHGLQQSCASCHNDAGTGSYGAGLVPGGDGVLSERFEEVR